MIIEKLYTEQTLGESIDSIDVEDAILLEELAEKYGVEGCFGILNEKGDKYYKSFTDQRFTRTGGYKQKGLSGVLQSIPSFALSAAISWPLTLIATLGAMSVRIQKRWDDEDAWRNRLNPKFWADFAATPHGQSTPHEIAALPVNAVKWGAGALVAGAGLIAGSDKLKAAGAKLKGKAKEGYDSAREKILGYKARTDSSIGATDSSMIDDEPTEDEMLTKAEVKNLDFRPYWVTFDNGEVIKVRANDATNARAFAEVIIKFLAATAFYEKMNELIKRGDAPKYKFWFSDGQISYMAKATEKESKNEVLKERKELCQAFNRSDSMDAKLDPLEAPTIIDRESQMGEEIKPAKKVKDVSAYPPERKDKSKDNLPKPPYNYGKMKHYKCVYKNFIFNIPAYEPDEAVKMMEEFIKEGVNIFEAIDRSMSYREPAFRFRFGDDDEYKIAAINGSHAQKIAVNLHRMKMKVIRNKIRPKEDFVVYESRWGKIVNSIKKQEPIPIDKNFVIKDGSTLKITRLLADGSVEDYPLIHIK